MNEDGKGNLPKKPFLLYASEASVNQLKQKGWKINLIKTFDDYLVTRLKGKFLNRKTRKEATSQTQLVLVQQQVVAK